ncbi:piggyBac transposable element-derived protein 4-like [Aphis craccivora]|uniref:PiggyBac transposable element-derived protein 4-like n=1 Tax=Aphis craccivora TaxID=307492 RepID=A0A6G0VK34_APHCR|nr:piggyBac transposable element-derived protein 4-like [Aphis craccivora]
MGYHVLPSWKDYWSSSPDLGVKFVSDAMSRNTFQKILQNLHCNDNTSLPSNNKDKLFKLRPIIDKLNTSFRNHYFGTRQLSVDESIVKFKGRSTLKQFNPMKPIKRGYKIWSMADQNGCMLAFKIYQGKDEIINPEFSGLGLGERVVLELTKSVWNQYREIYFDNFFSSTKLVQQLKLQKTLACDTVRTNRKGLPKKMKRGMSDSKLLADRISFFKWMDNKPVHLISNFHGSEITSVKRKSKDGSAVTIPCPTVVSDYDKYMGGVDHADRLRTLYNIDRKSPKWWHRLFFGLIDIMFVNSYVVYTTLFNKISVLEYRRSVVQGLLTKQSLKTKN